MFIAEEIATRPALFNLKEIAHLEAQNSRDLLESNQNRVGNHAVSQDVGALKSLLHATQCPHNIDSFHMRGQS